MTRSLVGSGLFALVMIAGVASAQQQQEQLRRNVEAVTQQFERAMNEGDAQAASELFTSDGRMVDAEGRAFAGRAAIASGLREHTLAKMDGGRARIEVKEVRPLGTDHVLVLSRQTLTGAGRTQTFEAVSVGRREQGRWRIVDLQIFPMRRPQAGVGGAGVEHQGLERTRPDSNGGGLEPPQTEPSPIPEPSVPPPELPEGTQRKPGEVPEERK